ncbi:MAG: Crp/Fnr family transcriptional regulator [Acidobacteria bacterium]|nr:Crp/Fnr family transcriptional regulator [Acidobacteriota bacterium]
MDVYKTLDNIRFFDGISKSGKTALAGRCIPIERPKHSVLFREGDAGDAMFFLVRGRIALHKVSQEGVETVIEVLKSGDTFAEVILFEQRFYPVTAVSLTDILIFSLQRRDLLSLLREETFRNDFIAMLLGKQRYLVNRMHQLTSRDVEQRLRAFLLEQYGERERISVEINKKQIAAAIGITPETLSRLLQDLGRRKLLTWKQGVIKIDPSFWEE